MTELYKDRDPEVIDYDYPASMRGLEFESSGQKLLGVLYSAQGAEARPLAIILHGFPGHERNFDIAQYVRRLGVHSLVFHYRGAWGSEGDFSFGHVREDVVQVVEQCCEAKFANNYRIDPEQIFIIGHSMGGWAALEASRLAVIKGIVSIAGVNLGMWGELLNDEPAIRPITEKFFRESLTPLKGCTSMGLVEELMQHQDDYDVMQKKAALMQKPLLLIAGKRDTTVEPVLHHTPLVRLLEKDHEDFSHFMLDTDHGFNDKRIQLCEMIGDWLRGKIDEQ